MFQRCCYNAMKSSCSAGTIVTRCQNFRLVFQKQSVRFVRNRAGASLKQLNPRSRQSSIDNKAGKEQPHPAFPQSMESDIEDVVEVRFLYRWIGKRREHNSSATVWFGYVLSCSGLHDYDMGSINILIYYKSMIISWSDHSALFRLFTLIRIQSILRVRRILLSLSYWQPLKESIK